MKILIHSNAPWVASGYGQQTRLLAQRLRNDHDVAISAFFGLHGSSLEWDGIMVYPGGVHQFGQDVIERHARHFFGGQRGLVLTLIDVWVFKGSELSSLAMASWVPIDNQPIPPVVYDFFVSSGSIPIAMSHFGKREFDKVGIKSFYVPLGIDTDTFAPMDRAECRDSLTFDQDAFIVGMVAANNGTPSRKAFPEAFRAMAPFMKENSDVRLYLHTDTSGLRGEGYNLPLLADRVGIPTDRLMECDQYLYANGFLSPKHMARVYNACDVLLNCSYGEGFGIPIIEAQACGTPVIATDFSAMGETANVGWLVGGQEVYTGLGSWQLVPDVAEITAALNEAYLRAGMLRDAARTFASTYDVDYVYDEYWKPTLGKVGETVKAKQMLLERATRLRSEQA